MISLVRAPQLADWALSRGRSALTTDELATVLGVPADHVRQRMVAPIRRREWVSPARGLWLAVPPEFRTWGAPPGIEVIGQLAAHLDVTYYIGWLSAAAVHGAAHQAPQVFQVAVARQVRDRQVGRTRFEFHQRDHVGQVPTESRETRSGVAHVSTPAVTALDVATDATISGGIDNAATVLVELSATPGFSVSELISTTPYFPVSAARRLGWILEAFGERDDLDELREVADQAAPTPARLDPSGELLGPLDRRWNVRINRELEPDL